MNQGKKVYVGLSGGVDSSVSAALLQEAGYDVTGVFIKVWSPDFLECTWKEDRRDAMRVCAALDIPFETLDLEKEYKEGVVDYMVSEYKAGRTPNPDVMCNREVKFGGFLRWAKEQGADFIATGHYAQNILNTKSGQYELWAGVDSEKDQSYFLWTLTQEDLKSVLFPIGHLKKPQVRELAEKFGLSTATKKDSQGLCFLGKLDMKDFLSHFIAQQEGKVLDGTGKEIGVHSGALFYTLGQRHGFTTSVQTPMYVTGKDIVKNTLTVALEPAAVTEGNTFALQKINWISGVPQPDSHTSRAIATARSFLRAL
jgi:tRNA-uridine 2-sulfurtransferase